MEVAPQELAALLKLAGVGSNPEPEMVAQPQVSAIAIPSEDEAPTGGCGGGSDMRSLIDALGHDEVEEEKEWENASQEFKGEPHTVQDNYDDFSYEPSGNSSMQRRTNGYGDNPLREEELIKEYTEFKKKRLKDLIKEESVFDKISNLFSSKNDNPNPEGYSTGDVIFRNGPSGPGNMIARVGQDGQVDWEYTRKEPTIATEPESSDDWGKPYVDPRKNWEKASDEDFFKVANLPAGFYGRLRDPEFRADVEKYEKAVRDGDLSPTGERARLMKKHPVLKMMTQKDTSITGNEIDTYIDPKFLKAVQVANRNEKLIPTGKTTTPSQGVVATPDADNIAPKADERRDEPDASGEERIKPPEVLQNPEEFDQSEIDIEVEPDSDERQWITKEPAITGIDSSDGGEQSTAGMDGPSNLGNFDYEDGVQSTAGMDDTDSVSGIDSSDGGEQSTAGMDRSSTNNRFADFDSEGKARGSGQQARPGNLYKNLTVVDDLPKPEEKSIDQQTISAYPEMGDGDEFDDLVTPPTINVAKNDPIVKPKKGPQKEPWNFAKEYKKNPGGISVNDKGQPIYLKKKGDKFPADATAAYNKWKKSNVASKGVRSADQPPSPVSVDSADPNLNPSLKFQGYSNTPIQQTSPYSDQEMGDGDYDIDPGSMSTKNDKIATFGAEPGSNTAASKGVRSFPKKYRQGSMVRRRID